MNLVQQVSVHSCALSHPGNLKGEDGAAERTVEDVFIRRFMFGTFHGCLANEVVIKRRGNMLIVCALMLQKLPPQKFYFLIGYSESLLSHFYKCPVKMEIQTLQDKVVYKYLWWKCMAKRHSHRQFDLSWRPCVFSFHFLLLYRKEILWIKGNKISYESVEHEAWHY